MIYVFWVVKYMASKKQEQYRRHLQKIDMGMKEKFRNSTESETKDKMMNPKKTKNEVPF